MFHHTFKITDTHVDHDSCHLFEHLVVRTFRDILERNGYLPGFAGEIDAMTSDDTITFELDAPNEKIVSLFASHLKTLKSFDKTFIDHEVLRIGAEDNEVYTITDDKTLTENLENLIQQAAGNSAAKKAQSSLALNHTDVPHYFTESTIVFSLKDFPATSRIFFTDAHSLILDIVYGEIVKAYPIYTQDMSKVILSDDDTQIGFAWQFRHPKQFLAKNIASDARHILKNFSMNNNSDQYGAFLKAYDLQTFKDVISEVNVDII